MTKVYGIFHDTVYDPASADNMLSQIFKTKARVRREMKKLATDIVDELSDGEYFELNDDDELNVFSSDGDVLETLRIVELNLED